MVGRQPPTCATLDTVAALDHNSVAIEPSIAALGAVPGAFLFALGMTPGAYLLGLAMAAVYLSAAAWCGAVLRRVLLPGWRGAPGALASSVLALFVFLTVCEALGSVGWFSRWALLVASAVVAGAATLLYRRPRGERRPSPLPPAPPVSAFEAGLTVAAVALALVPFVRRIGFVYRHGMLEWDTLWYHEPVAARFAQTGDVTQLQYVNNSADSFVPFNAELVHAVGLLATGRDVLSPLVNLGWLALALVAAWSIGSVWRARAAAVAATALLISTPVLVYASAGSVGNDLPGLALLLVAIALIVNAPKVPPAIALAGVAAGLAVGTKLTLVAPVLALTAALCVIWIRSRSWGLARVWWGAVIVAGSFWYLRNAVRAHNPFPWFELGIGRFALPSSTTPPRDCGSRTVAHYVTDTDVMRSVFKPALVMAFGSWWAIVLATAAVGVLVSVRGRTLERVLGAVALFSALAYLVTPATAGGREGVPTCFEYNTRFATPAVALGLLLVALASARWGRTAPVVVGLALTAVVAVNIPYKAVGLPLAAVAGIAVGAAVHTGRRSTPRVTWAALAAVVLVATGVGWPVQRYYYDHRYGDLPEPIEQSVLRLRDVRDARIAVGGLNTHYPLYDPELSNWVDFPVARGPHGIFRRITACREWQAALAAGRYDYVVTYNSYEKGAPPEAGWTRSYPSALRIVHAGGSELFELEPESGPQRFDCPAGS